MKRVLVLAVAAVASITVGGGAAQAMVVKIQNRTGRPASDIYVMLFNGSSSDGQLVDRVPKRLSDLRGEQFDVRSLPGGRIYFSYDKPVLFNEPFTSPTRFDWVELTYPGGTMNLTAVDQFAIPMKVETKDSSGRVLGTLGYSENTQQVEDQLLAIPGAANALVKTTGGALARIKSPQLAPFAYPEFGAYLTSVNGQSLTVQGRFFGTPAATFEYTGTVTGGAITLGGKINGAAGQDLAIARGQLAPAIYTADGDFTVGGRPAKVSDNNVYSVIYRDLISGFAWGYWGGIYGNANTAWQGKPPFAAARRAPAAYATYNEYADVIYQHSSAYGFSFSDTGPKPVQLGFDRVAQLDITLPDDGVPTGRALLSDANLPSAGRIVTIGGAATPVARVACPSMCGQVTVTAVTKRVLRGRARTATVAEVTARIGSGQSRRLTLSLTPVGRRLLVPGRRMEAQLTVSLLSRNGRVTTATEPATLIR